MENSLSASRFLLEKWTIKPENVSLGHLVKRLFSVWTILMIASSLFLYPKIKYEICIHKFLTKYSAYQAQPWWPQLQAPCQFLQQSRSYCLVHMESSLPDWVSRCHTRTHSLDPYKWNIVKINWHLFQLYLNCCQTEMTSSMIFCWVGETFGPFEPRMFWLECLTFRQSVDEKKENERNCVNVYENFILF